MEAEKPFPFFFFFFFFFAANNSFVGRWKKHESFAGGVMQSYWVMKDHCSSPHPPFWHCNYLKYVNHRAFVFLTEPSLGSARRAFRQVHCKSIPAKRQENVTRGPNSFKRKRLLEINLRIVVSK